VPSAKDCEKNASMLCFGILPFQPGSNAVIIDGRSEIHIMQKTGGGMCWAFNQAMSLYHIKHLSDWQANQCQKFSVVFKLGAT